MNLLKILFAFIVIFSSLTFDNSHAAINFTVTPLKYDIEANPWETVTRVAQIRNNGTGSVVLTTWSSDFQANGPSGVPSFVRKSELVYPDQQLSSWININVASLSLDPGETKSFVFTIDVPTDATPGWHYGAVFFKNPNSESGSGWEIAINVDYWVLLIVNVSWDVIVDVEVEPVIITWGSGGGWWWGGASAWYTKDTCPFWDFTKSKYDGKCIGTVKSWSGSQEVPNSEEVNWEFTTDENGNIIDTNNSSLESFEVSFQVPINNKWNTHVQPTGKIKLVDEDGKEIKWVGKEVKKNDYWAVVGEEIVDYLPLNDEWGNVLPKTKRNFETIWKGFPYKTFDDRGNEVIQYWKPWEYYTMKNMAENKFLMPWQRIAERIKTKKIQAIIELTHKNEDGEDVSYESAKEFEIEYTEQYIWLNPYVVLPILLLISLWLFIWFIIAKRRKKCINKKCEKRLKRNIKICPYCWEKQEKIKKDKQEKTKKEKKKISKKKKK